MKEFLRTSKLSVVRLYDSSKKFGMKTEEEPKFSIFIELSRFRSGCSDIYASANRTHNYWPLRSVEVAAVASVEKSKIRRIDRVVSRIALSNRVSSKTIQTLR